MITKISELTQDFLVAGTLKQFQSLIVTHEGIVSEALNLPKVKDTLFSDFSGAIKSLGAWGGDFVLVATEHSMEYVKNYFNEKGLTTLYRYSDLITDPIETQSKDSVKMGFSNHLLH